MCTCVVGWLCGMYLRAWITCACACAFAFAVTNSNNRYKTKTTITTPASQSIWRLLLAPRGCRCHGVVGHGNDSLVGFDLRLPGPGE